MMPESHFSHQLWFLYCGQHHKIPASLPPPYNIILPTLISLSPLPSPTPSTSPSADTHTVLWKGIFLFIVWRTMWVLISAVLTQMDTYWLRDKWLLHTGYSAFWFSKHAVCLLLEIILLPQDTLNNLAEIWYWATIRFEFQFSTL